MQESESCLFSPPFLDTRQGQSRIKVALLDTSNLSSKILGIIEQTGGGAYCVWMEEEDDGLCSWHIILFVSFPLNKIILTNLTKSLENHQMAKQQRNKTFFFVPVAELRLFRQTFACLLGDEEPWGAEMAAGSCRFTPPLVVKSWSWSPGHTAEERSLPHSWGKVSPPVWFAGFICKCPHRVDQVQNKLWFFKTT